MRKLAALAAVVAAVAVDVSAASAADSVQIQLPVVGLGLPGQPPLSSSSSGAQGFYLGKMRVRERVIVGVDGAGAPASVRVLHRIALRGKGDYKLAVPGPIEQVAPLPGEERQPGLHTDTLLWSGYSPAARVLGAVARLRLRDSAPYLPLRLAVTRRGTTVELRIENRTASRFPAPVADPRPEDVARVLDGLRSSVGAGNRFVNIAVPAPRPGTQERFPVAAAFTVRGALSAGRRRAPFAAVVGRPFTARLTDVPPGVRPRVELTATPVALPAVLVPPDGASSWREVVARGGLGGRDLIRIADRALLQLELTRKYDEFLEPPSRLAPTGTSYAYVSAPAPAPRVAAASGGGGGGNGLLVPVLAGLLGALGLGALAVLWAHS